MKVSSSKAGQSVFARAPAQVLYARSMTCHESYLGIYSTYAKDRMGCEIPMFIEFRSLPVNVQDDLMRADILPTMRSRCRISGYERVFCYKIMTVVRRAMLFDATCRDLTPKIIQNTYPEKIDDQHRDWIKD